MRIALCDHDINCVINTKQLIYKYANTHRLEIVVDEFFSGETIIYSDTKYIMILIEYHLNKPDGLETAKKLRSRGFCGAIIFYSRQTDSILPSFTVSPYRFLAKPIKESDLFSTLDAFFCSFGTDHPLWIKDGDDIACLNTGDIFYLEAANKHCYVNLKSEKILCRKTMARVSQVLPKNHFFRINRAFIVNLNFIKSYNKDFVFLLNGERLHISRNYYKSFKNEYHDFIDPFVP